jgi:uncharacterized protein
MELSLEFEWDPAKAKSNLRKHSVPFLMACEIFKDESRVERADASGEHGEERWIVLGRIGHTILSVVCTQREEQVRLISARKANRDEERIYWTGDVSA